MQSDGQQAADFIEVLYPTLKRAGLKTQIACCDGSGWEQNRERLTGIQQAGKEGELGLVTSHGYSSYPGAPFQTNHHVWQTEWSTFVSCAKACPLSEHEADCHVQDPINYNWYTAATGGSQSDGLTWANNIQKLFSISNANGHLYWWGVSILSSHFLRFAR